jgi:molybdopterin-guanine dinucleotide biosynthesis protein A
VSEPLLIAILLGGEGSRINGSKPQRMLAGKRLVDHVVDRASQWSDVIYAVDRESSHRSHARLPLIRDDPKIEGPLGGLAAALRFASDGRYDVVLTLPCDTPFLPPDLPGRLREALGDEVVAMPASGGRLHPICAMWRIQALDLLDPYLSSGRRSLQGFAEYLGHAVVEWDAIPIDPFFNINSEADLTAAEALGR